MQVLVKAWCLLQIRDKKHFYFWILVLLSGCAAKKENHPPVVFSLQQIGRLATAEYLVTRLVKAEDNQTWYKIGNRKILISCTASVKAGIDFTKLEVQQVRQDEKRVSVQLPPPQILYLNIPPESIKVAYTDVSLFRDPFTTAEVNNIMKTAERQIQQQIAALHILETARSNASAFVTHFLTTAGFNEVYVSFQ
jgi:hypothetical protein